MRKLDYNNPGTKADLDRFLVNLGIKSKGELLILLKHVAECCDMEGKGYVNQWEQSIRHAIGYTRGESTPHAASCGCDQCLKEHTGVYFSKRSKEMRWR